MTQDHAFCPRNKRDENRHLINSPVGSASELELELGLGLGPGSVAAA